MKLDIQRVPLSTLASFMLAIASHPHSKEDVIAKFAGDMSMATAKRTIPVLLALGLVSRDTAGMYQCTKTEVRRGMPNDEALLVIRRALHNFRPFEAICEGVMFGESESEAIRRASIILSVENPGVLDVLVKWGEELGIFVRENGAIRLAPELVSRTASVAVAGLSSRDITSEAAARLYNASRIGRDANNFLDEIDRTLLAKAQLECPISPDDSLEKSGKALEDYLREVAGVKGLTAEAAKCSGAGQLGSMLVGQGVIHTHLNQIVQAISTSRNMTAHHKDKKL